jgi:DNA repair exonuclease SbcCD nuclease subunit
MRVRFLQTSDVHLRSDRPERFRSLELVLQEAVARSADAVLIVGDLFDRVSDAAAARAFVRELVDGSRAPVVFAEITIRLLRRQRGRRANAVQPRRSRRARTSRASRSSGSPTSTGARGRNA